MRSVNVLVKPASSLCNLRCRYCFYADEAQKRQQASMGLMREETAALLIEEAYRAVDPHGAVSFAFQGGEPTVAGLAFFRSFTALAKARRPKGAALSFSIQTNGMLLDEDWARFLKEEGYLVGVSLDGFADLHNANRVDAEGKGSWNRALRGAALLQKAGVPVNALCVVTAQCARSPVKAYQTLKKLGFDYIQFIACLDPIGQARGGCPWSLTPEGYGKFLCQLFDLWFRDWESGRYHSIRLFDDYIHLLLGEGGGTCATCGNCGAYFVVEADGSVYPCDFFVLDEWRLGRLGEQSLTEMAESETAKRFLAWGQEKPAACADCPYRSLCNGGCKNDWERGHNYYCTAFCMLFAHAHERMRWIAQAELQARRTWKRGGRG